MARELHEQLTKYLTDAHSIEVQALAQLRTAPELAGDAELERAFREHLSETEGHERLTRELLEARGEKPARLKDAVMGVGGKGFLLFARLQPDTPGKLLAHGTASPYSPGDPAGVKSEGLRPLHARARAGLLRAGLFLVIGGWD